MKRLFSYSNGLSFLTLGFLAWSFVFTFTLTRRNSLTTFMRWFVCFKTFTLRIAFRLTFTSFVLLLLALTSAFFFVSLNHSFELLVLPELFLFLFLLVTCSLSSFLLESSTSPSHSESFFIFENWLIVDVLELRYFRYNALTIMRNLFVEAIVLHVNNWDAVHLHQNFRQKLLSLYLIARNI